MLGRFVGNNLIHDGDTQVVVKNPGDYGLAYEDVRLTTDDDVSIAAWLIPSHGDRVALMTHPMGHTRYGYSKDHQGRFKLYDKDVEFIPTAKHLVDAGYSVVMIDFRNHGESGKSPNGGVNRGGLDEYRDIAAAVKFIADHPDLSGKPLAFVGFCYGSYTSLITQSKEPELLRRAGLTAAVVVQPLSWAAFFRAYRFPRWLIRRAEKYIVKQGAPSLDEMMPPKYAPDVIVPTLVVQGRDDPWTELDEVEATYDAIPTEKQMLWLDEPKHRFDAYNYFNDHPEPLLEFLDTHMSGVSR